MSDTIQIPRPLFCRRQKDDGGRTKVDESGRIVAVKTRFSDTQELPEISSASIALEPDGEEDRTGG